MKLSKQNTRGFTLLELLVVITVISILISAAAIAINPPELLKRARDARRIQDMDALKKAIDLSLSKDGVVLEAFGDSVSGSRDVDGTGYVKVDISENMTALPHPPRHGEVVTSSLGNEVVSAYYFQGEPGTLRYEIKTPFESQTYLDRLETDGGNEPDYFELGTDLSFELP